MQPWTFSDGWWPRLSDDGRILACGNLDLKIVDVKTREQVTVGRWDPDGRFGAKSLHRCLRLIGNRKATWVEHMPAPDGTDLPGYAWRWEADVLTNPLRVVNASKTADDPWLVAPSWFEAGAGHWASSLVHPQGRTGLTYDNVNLGESPHFMSMSRNGSVLSVSDMPVFSMMMLVRPDGTVGARPMNPSGANVFRLHDNGWFGYGYWGPARVANTRTNEVIDISISPSLKESPPVLATGPGGQVWAWTTIMDANENQWVMGRPFWTDGRVETSGILVATIAGATENMDVVFAGGTWVIATASDVGTGALYYLSADTARKTLTGAAPFSERQMAQASGAVSGDLIIADILKSANTKSALIAPQLGLLEDDIVYRLSLLAVNVLAPIKKKFPNLAIKSGFRQVNNGISQHELGEAVDLQVTNQTPLMLYEMAKWIEANVNFDQLILNFTDMGDKQPWIHVSFSPSSLRQQVLTKDLADTFHEGLFLVEALTGEAAAAARRAQQQTDTMILREIAKLQIREARLNPKTIVQDDPLSNMPDSTGLTSAYTAGEGTAEQNLSSTPDPFDRTG